MPMPIPVQTITPGRSLPLSLGNPLSVAALVLYNQSPNELTVIYGSGGLTIPPYVGDCIYLNDSNYSGQITITPTSLSSAANAPSSVVTGYTYAAGETVRGTFPVNLGQLTNVGNGSLPVTSAQAVINDGNAPLTTVVEATQTGQTTSSLKMLNDGTVLVAPLSAGALLDAIDITPGGAVTKATGVFGDSANPANWLFHGIADQVPASGVQSGALAAGVTVTAAQVGTGYPAADIAAGTLVGGVHLTSLTSDGGALTSDGSGNLTAATVTTKTVYAKPTASNDAIFVYRTTGTLAETIGDNGSGFYIYDQVNGGFALEGITKTANVMTDRNTTVQANRIFTGTTTPTSPAIGDIWCNA